MIGQIIDVAIPLLTFFMMCLVGIDLDRIAFARVLAAKRLIAALS